MFFSGLIELRCASHFLPINDSSFVKKLQTADHLRCIKSGSIIFKLPIILNVKHEVTAIEIFHDKEQMALNNKAELYAQLFTFQCSLNVLQTVG